MTIAKKVLTEVSIRNWRPTTNRDILWDALVPGLGVRASGNGRKKYVLVKRYPGAASPAPRTIGEYGVMGLEDVRTVAREWSLLVKAGKDPAIEEQRKREAEEQARREVEAAKARADASTFAAAFELYAATHLTTLRTGKDVEQDMRRVLLPVWGSRPLASLTRNDVSSIVYGIYDAGTPISANRMLAFIKKFDKWAFNRSLIDVPFAHMVQRPAKENERDRILSSAEIRALWVVCGHLRAYGSAVRMLLATGARREEVMAMLRTEIDRDAALWTLPRSRTKSDRRHKLPLSRLALSIIDERPVLGVHVFTTKGRGPLNGDGRAKGRLDALMLAELRKTDPNADLPNWRIHDLRRTCASNLARLGVDRIVISKILNHAETSVTARYDRYGRDVEMAEALEAWGDELQRIVAGSANTPDERTLWNEAFTALIDTSNLRPLAEMCDRARTMPPELMRFLGELLWPRRNHFPVRLTVRKTTREKTEERRLSRDLSRGHLIRQSRTPGKTVEDAMVESAEKLGLSRGL